MSFNSNASRSEDAKKSVFALLVLPVLWLKKDSTTEQDDEEEEQDESKLTVFAVEKKSAYFAGRLSVRGLPDRVVTAGGAKNYGFHRRDMRAVQISSHASKLGFSRASKFASTRRSKEEDEQRT